MLFELDDTTTNFWERFGESYRLLDFAFDHRTREHASLLFRSFVILLLQTLVFVVAMH